MVFENSEIQKKIRIMIFSLAAVVCIYTIFRLSGCGVQEDAPEGNNGVCGDLELGDVRKTACPGGATFKVEACTENGLDVIADCNAQLPNCGKTTFAEVKSLLDAKCVKCHAGYGSYAKAKEEIGEMIQRIGLSGNDPRRMPKPPAPELSNDQKDLLKRWQVDGAIEACPGGDTQAHVPFSEIERAMRDRVEGLPENDRLTSRFLILSHKVNQNVPRETIQSGISAVAKALNSLSRKNQRLVRVEAFGPGQSIIHFDLDDFRLVREDWEAISSQDPFRLESFTKTGEVLKFLTQTKRPWMHFDNFIDVTHRKSALYYYLLAVPPSLEGLAIQQGVDYAGDLKDFSALLVGTNHSPISLQKNRLISRHESLNGYFYVSYDPVALGGVRERNLFEAPLLAEARGSGKTNFNFAASEVIYSLPNGMQAYALYANQARAVQPPAQKTVLQQVAPLNIVADNESPISPEIRNANSCVRCHDRGVIPAVDEIRDHVIRNASEFERLDVDIVRALYKPNNVVADIFRKDAEFFVNALAQIGVTSSPDPMSQATDRLLLNWDLAQTAAFFFLTVEEFVEGLNGSARGKAQIGQLLTGGTVTYDQVLQVLPILIEDLRLFQDPIEGI